MIESDAAPDSPRNHGMTPIQAIGILVACTALLYALTALLPGP